MYKSVFYSFAYLSFPFHCIISLSMKSLIKFQSIRLHCAVCCLRWKRFELGEALRSFRKSAIEPAIHLANSPPRPTNSSSFLRLRVRQFLLPNSLDFRLCSPQGGRFCLQMSPRTLEVTQNFSRHLLKLVTKTKGTHQLC